MLTNEEEMEDRSGDVRWRVRSEESSAAYRVTVCSFVRVVLWVRVKLPVIVGVK